MNKTAIKNFAVWARRKLIAEITYKAGLLGITEKGIAEPLPQSAKGLQFFDIGTKDYTQVAGNEIAQRDALVAKIKEKEKSLSSTLHSQHSTLSTAFQAVVEEVAYTWFNRLIAVRFMEVNDYLPSGIRVLSSADTAKQEPDFVTTPFNTDLDFSDYDRDRVMQLKDENKLDELFRMLFIKQCNKLGEILPELFEKTEDYTELLLNISFTDKDGVLYRLTHDIEEDDFKEAVEIIGWLYQFYNTEPKDETFALLKKNVKITKERIPSATQLFTPDWIVRYMVENSLGRLWIEHLESEKGYTYPYTYPKHYGKDNSKTIAQLKTGWKYYLEEAEQTEEVKQQLGKIRAELRGTNIEDVKLIDPCMGSGHILVYAFDVLMDIYKSCGYAESDAAKLIVEKNLYGLDIDDRATQLAYFAVMMKGRQYDRRFLTSGIKPNLCAVQESNSLNNFEQGARQIKLVDIHKQTANYLIDIFRNAKEFGSILNVEQKDYEGLLAYIEKLKQDGAADLFVSDWLNNISEFMPALIQQAKIMAQKYAVVVTNPPYMGSSGMSTELLEYVQRYYPDSKSDLFAVFIEKCGDMAKRNGYQAMITQHAWMFLPSFEKLRSKLLFSNTVNMAHLGARAFNEIGGEVVQTTAFVIENANYQNYIATYARLVEYNSQQTKEYAFLAKNNLHTAQKENFYKIPGMPIVYWVTEKGLKAFSFHKIGEILYPKTGVTTGDNDKFLRLWFEVKDCDISLKWYPLNKGGECRKWYGNNDYVVDWYKDGLRIKNFSGSTIRNEQYYFREGVTWSKICSGNFSSRYSSKSNMFDAVGLTCFVNEEVSIEYLLAFMCSDIVNMYVKMLNPTLSYTVGTISNIPFIYSTEKAEVIENLSKLNIDISRIDWDSFETSRDFKKHPLI